MICRKCKKEVPDGRYCIMCGTDQQAPAHKMKSRGNGQGSVYKRGKTYTAVYVRGYKPLRDSKGNPVIDPNGKIRKTPDKITKGGFATKKEALAYLPVLKETTRPKKYGNITFQKLYDKWVERHKERVVKSTMNCYKAAYKYYADIYHMVFADLSTEDWQLCVDDCPRGKRTKENMKALGTLLYGYAYELKITTENYAAHIYIPRMETESRNAFPRETVQKILDAANRGVPYADYVAILCFTGFRPSALLQMHTGAFDAEHATLCGGIKTDAGKNRIVTIPPAILPLVKKRAQSDIMFPRGDGSEMDDAYFRERYFYPLLAELGIQPVPEPKHETPPLYTPYSCRHTFATLMKAVKGADKDKAALMGHTSYEMTLRYQHADYDSMRAITDNLWLE